MSYLAVYFHTIDPYAIKLWEGGPIRWYGLSYLAGFVAGLLILRWVSKAGFPRRTTLKAEHAMDFVVTVAVGVVVGGRLGYVLFYKPSLFIEFESGFPWWGVLALNKGGMASHGGFLGVVAGCWWYARRHGHRFTHLLDLAVFSAPLGLMFGRIANFINGELLGRPCDPSFPLAMKFPQEMTGWAADPRHHADSLELLRPAVEKLHELGETSLPALGSLPGSDQVSAIIRFLQEGSGVARQQVIDIVEPLLTPRYPSQLFQGFAEGIVLFAVLLIIWRKPRRPGVLFAWTITVYSVLRIITEHFREPDADLRSLEFQWTGLTRGQVLSIVLASVGAGLIFWFKSRKGEPMGGWRKELGGPGATGETSGKTAGASGGASGGK